MKVNAEINSIQNRCLEIIKITAIRQTDEHRELYSGSAVVMRISHKILAVYL